MKKLLIVESPAKIKTISKFLGKEFTIMSTLGHIKDLPTRSLGIELTQPITFTYVPLTGKNKVIQDIVKQAKTSSEIYLAPDPDREGEIIAWHIGQEIEKARKSSDHIHRITFNEITQPAIIQALEHPTMVDVKKVAAQQARRALDRWVGYEVSPILWRKIHKGLSAGRVQSVALKLIVNREEEINQFKPKEYWSIDADFVHAHGLICAPLALVDNKKIEIDNKTQADALLRELPHQTYTITDIQDKQRKKNALPPFMTSTLQQAAYNRLGFAVKKTMQVAQQLYEGVTVGTDSVALITYMRTDSLRVAQTALDATRAFIQDTYGTQYLPAKPLIYEKSKKAQDAHEAIRPIDITKIPDHMRPYLNNDEIKLYTLIWQRFVASQMNAALYAQRQVTIAGGLYTFKVTGSTLLFDGFLKIYISEEDEKEKKIALPNEIAIADTVTLKKLDPKQHFTQPPARYTEASLVKALEKEAIGRPSTYASILATIRKRDYTTLDEKKQFVPTELGNQVTDLLEKNLPKIMNLKFTALMEEDLDKVAEGTMERDALLNEFYREFSSDLEKFAESIPKKTAQPTNLACPQCNKPLVIRTGKSGAFVGCSGFPQCKFTSNFTTNQDGTISLMKHEQPKLLDTLCPLCGKPLQERRSKYGAFIACSGYPTCKYVQQKKAPFKCPHCASDIVQRTWRGGKFWGCSQYPTCRFAIFGDIQETPCPQCNAPFLAKKVNKDGSATLFCFNKTCSYKSEQH
jgi:DNA topoisomerase-1